MFGGGDVGEIAIMMDDNIFFVTWNMLNLYTHLLWILAQTKNIQN